MALTDNLVSYWKLDESSGNASDSVGSNTLTNNNSVAYATGKINNGADFSSTNTNKTLTNSGSIGIDSGNISISAWVKRESSDCMLAVNQQSATSNVSYKIKYESGIKAVRNIAGGSEDQTTAQAISISTWAHVVLTYDGSTVRCYVNGGTPQTVASSGTGTGVTSKFTIGADNSTGGTDQFFWDGMIDEVGVWNVALTSTEVTSLYNAGTGIQYPFGNAYTLALAVGTYILSGQSLNLTSARKMIMAVGSYTLTGFDAVLKRGYGMIMEAGSYILTGFNTTFRSSGWTNGSKSSTATFTQTSKSSSTWTNRGKNQ